ncbi:MAG: site-2 protease family protein [Candidatus Limnocylindrales bacterium]
MQSIDVARTITWIALFFLVSGPIHECAHAITALRLGDGTAKLFGRVSLDPVVHFDPMGGMLLIVTALLGLASGGGIAFGWAKPTPVNPYNLRGRYANARVAAAGPFSNLILAAVFAAGFRILYSNWAVWPDNTSALNMLQLVFVTGVSLNVVLMLFNLIPIAPLDGSHVLIDLLDPSTGRQVQQFMNQYGLFLLIVIVLFAGRIIGPFVGSLVNLLIGVNYYL